MAAVLVARPMSFQLRSAHITALYSRPATFKRCLELRVLECGMVVMSNGCSDDDGGFQGAGEK